MAYLVGVLLAATVCGFATIAGLDRDRAFYPTVTIVIASYYGLFAVMGGSTRALLAESVGITAFLIVAVVGFIHANVIADPGVPEWWPPFCLAYDVVTEAYLAVRLRSDPVGR